MGHIAITNYAAPTTMATPPVQKFTNPEIADRFTRYWYQWFHGAPPNNVVYMQNWRGYNTWQGDMNQVANTPYGRLDYPLAGRYGEINNRLVVQNINPGYTVLVLERRNPANPLDPTPIPYQDYVAGTAMNQPAVQF